MKGKSTFPQILAGNSQLEFAYLEPGKRMSVLEQNHNAF